MEEFKSAGPDIDENPYRDQVGQKRRAAVAHEGQGDADNGHDP